MSANFLDSGSTYEPDNKALLLLLKGACLHQMQRPYQSEECLKAVINMEKHIKDDHYIVPFALVELALVHNSQGDTRKAVQLLENVKYVETFTYLSLFIDVMFLD